MSSVFNPKVLEQQLKADEERWYAIGDGRSKGITTIWHICSILTRCYPGASFRKFKSRADAEEWMLRVHGIESPDLIDLAAARAAVASEEAAAAAASLPALAPLPAAVPSSSPPSSTPPGSMGQLFQLLQQNFGDARTMEALKHLLSVPAASSTATSNESLAGGSGALPGSSSSPDDPVFSPHVPHTGRKSL
ncbi:uncharacterized protein FFB14_04952 [Fusarium fujikuroi]|nr:uncharacterized protein FFB14_04952 [Fusarium fujikuroi]